MLRVLRAICILIFICFSYANGNKTVVLQESTNLSLENIKNGFSKISDSVKIASNESDGIKDSLISYLNHQDWSYLKAANDWSWSGNLIILFNDKGVIKKVRSDIQSGHTHKDDLLLGTRGKFKRQVRKSLRKKDLSHLNPPKKYIVKVLIKYNSSNKEVIWSR